MAKFVMELFPELKQEAKNDENKRMQPEKPEKKRQKTGVKM